MTEQHEAPGAPATAVEAEQGASTGASAPTHNTNPVATTTAPSVEEAPHAAPDATPQAAPSESAEGSPSEDEGSEEGDEPEAGEQGAASATDPQRKKRRRRRRKKPGAKEPGAAVAGDGAVAEGATPPSEKERPQREGAGGVFSRFFDGPNAGKRHAFSAGEVVAGRVVRINDGAFVVDLFGKATAFVDVFEPHEVPAIPEPPPAQVESAQVESAQVESSQAAEGAVAASEGAEPATSPGGEAEPSAEGTPAERAESPLSSETIAQTVVAPSEPEPIAEPSAEQPPVAAPESLAGDPAALGSGPATGASAAIAAAGASEIEPESAQPSEPSASAQPSTAAGHDVSGEASAAHADGEHPEESHPEESHHEESAAEPEPEPPPPPELGTIFRGRIGSVAESGHVVIVNRIIDAPAAKQRIVRAREQRQRVRGVVYGFNRGGFDVLVEGVRVFCPASGMALGAIENPESLLGQRLEFTVPPSKAGTHGLVVSRRGILERQQRKAAKQLFRSLTPGQRLHGRVTQVREFGLFVDLGGFEGLVHQSELSFSRGVRPEDVAKVGDEIDVQVLRVGEGQTRKERERVSLSLKSLQSDPWGAHNELLEPGNIVVGKVVRTTEFGAFIELAPQIEGLLHISELGRELKHANQALEEGQELRVVVERIDRKARRISLSKLSPAEEKSLDAGTDAKSGRPPKPGAHLTVVVDKVDHAGLIVQVPGVFGRRGRGFIPNSEMGTERGTDHRRGFPPGTQIPVKAIGVDRDGGFRFSRKALLVEEEKKAVQDYRREAARHGLGTFGDLLRAKLEGTKQGS